MEFSVLSHIFISRPVARAKNLPRQKAIYEVRSTVGRVREGVPPPLVGEYGGPPPEFLFNKDAKS